ncbi:MAG: hypothetical protein CBE00_04135 [Planctomycetaceae bacterium TMED240]|nr:MAG: hypothetical protein CBE00_04135 [Planctomycetaceae bacterium TMED240]
MGTALFKDCVFRRLGGTSQQDARNRHSKEEQALERLASGALAWLDGSSQALPLVERENTLIGVFSLDQRANGRVCSL